LLLGHLPIPNLFYHYHFILCIYVYIFILRLEALDWRIKICEFVFSFALSWVHQVKIISD